VAWLGCPNRVGRLTVSAVENRGLTKLYAIAGSVCHRAAITVTAGGNTLATETLTGDVDPVLIESVSIRAKCELEARIADGLTRRPDNHGGTTVIQCHNCPDRNSNKVSLSADTTD